MAPNLTQPSSAALMQAKEKVEKEFLPKHGVHTVMIGEVERDGENKGIGVVVLVNEKIPKAQLASDELIPQCVRVTAPAKDGVVTAPQNVLVDVQVAPQPKGLRLPLSQIHSFARAQAGEAWQGCFDCPIPGGVQIAPAKANWVGTLSAAVEFDDGNGNRKLGAFTNYHVVGGHAAGVLMGQPDGYSGDWFAKTVRTSPMTGNQNLVDCGLLDTWRDDGKYAPGVHTVKPEQFQLGRINPDPQLRHAIGDAVQKSGRTTGVTKGRVAGIEATSQIDYGEDGVLTFVRQTVIRGDAGDFSQPGDSGSLVLTPDMRPYALLFAGGGGTTIVNPISFVIDMFKMRFLN